MSLSKISANFTDKTLDEIAKRAGGTRCRSWRFADGGFTKGDSFLSELYRVIVDCEGRGEVKTIIKAFPDCIARRKTFRSPDFFRNEIAFYSYVIPSFERFQQSKSIDHPFTEWPLCLSSHSDGQSDFLVLEDLSYDGYRSAPRQQGLDLEHCRLALRTLGRLHGLSFALKDQNPAEFERVANALEETYYAPKYKSWYIKFSESQMVVARDAVHREYPNSPAEQKMESLFSGCLFDKMCKMVERQSTRFPVISHGDCWMPNFLFRYLPNNTPTECRIIDFQLARCASPVLDLSFFLYSCTLQSFRELHWDDLLKAYHDGVAELVTALGTDIEKVFPYSALLEEIRIAGRFGVGMGIESVPFSCMEDEDAPDLSTMTGEDEVPITNIWIFRPIKTKEGRLRLADMFKHATEIGYLD